VSLDGASFTCAFAEAGIGHSLIGGDEQPVFVAVLAIGLIFEGAWYLAHRTNAVTPAQTEPADRMGHGCGTRYGGDRTQIIQIWTAGALIGISRQLRWRWVHEQAPLRSQAVIDGKRTQHLTQPPAVAAAYAATLRSLASVIAAFNAEITAMEEQLTACLGQTRDAEIYRYATARNRKNYAGTSPVTRASGKKKIVLARFIHNDRLVDALHQQAFCALTASPGARAYYDELRRRGTGHRTALRELSAGWSASCTAA
jgi:Transposase IS116/IS110/IS902 family